MTSSPRLLEGLVPAVLEPVRIGVHDPSTSHVDPTIRRSSHAVRHSAILPPAFSSSNSGALSPTLPGCLCGVSIGALGAFAPPEQRKTSLSGWLRSGIGGYHRPLQGRYTGVASGWRCSDSSRLWRSGHGRRVAEEARERVVVPVPERDSSEKSGGFWR